MNVTTWSSLVMGAVTLCVVGCGPQVTADVALPAPSSASTPAESSDASPATAVFAAGCFWCVEAVFETLEGVTDVESGYAGGSAETARYALVSAGKTDHAEAVRVSYDPSRIDYSTLLHVFFSTHDPTTVDGQHPDYGRQYRSSVFFVSDAQRDAATAYVSELNGSGLFDRPLATEITPLDQFFPAEAYHQDYVLRNPHDPYVRRWALPKLAKLQETFPDLLTVSSESTTRPARGQPGIDIGR